MNLRTLTLLLLATLSLLACGKPIPPAKAFYVGEWESPTMYLLITQDGSVVYKRQEAGVSNSIEPLFKNLKAITLQWALDRSTQNSKLIHHLIKLEMSGKWLLMVLN